jgi:hypothetical protein
MSYTSFIKGTVLFVTMAVASIAFASLLSNVSDDALPATLLGYMFRSNTVEENDNDSNDLFHSASRELNVKSDAAMQSRWLFLDGKDNNNMSYGNSDEREIEKLDLFAIDSVTGLQNDDTNINRLFDTTSPISTTIKNVDALPLLPQEQFTTSSLTSSQPQSGTTANTTASNTDGASRRLFVATDNYKDHDFYDFIDLLSAHNDLADHDKLHLCIDFFLPPSKDCGNSIGKGRKFKSGSKSSKSKVTKGKSRKSTGKNGTKGKSDKSTGKNGTKGKSNKNTGKNGTKGKSSKSTGKHGKSWEYDPGGKGAENASGGKGGKNDKSVSSKSSNDEDKGDSTGEIGISATSKSFNGKGLSVGKDRKEGKSEGKSEGKFKSGKYSSKGVDGPIDYGKDDSKGGKSSTKSDSKRDNKSGKKEKRFRRLLAPQGLDSNHVRISRLESNRTERREFSKEWIEL